MHCNGLVHLLHCKPQLLDSSQTSPVDSKALSTNASCARSASPACRHRCVCAARTGERVCLQPASHPRLRCR